MNLLSSPPAPSSCAPRDPPQRCSVPLVLLAEHSRALPASTATRTCTSRSRQRSPSAAPAVRARHAHSLCRCCGGHAVRYGRPLPGAMAGPCGTARPCAARRGTPACTKRRPYPRQHVPSSCLIVRLGWALLRALRPAMGPEFKPRSSAMITAAAVIGARDLSPGRYTPSCLRHHPQSGFRMAENVAASIAGISHSRHHPC